MSEKTIISLVPTITDLGNTLIQALNHHDPPVSSQLWHRYKELQAPLSGLLSQALRLQNVIRMVDFPSILGSGNSADLKDKLSECMSVLKDLESSLGGRAVQRRGSRVATFLVTFVCSIQRQREIRELGRRFQLLSIAIALICERLVQSEEYKGVVHQARRNELLTRPPRYTETDPANAAPLHLAVSHGDGGAVIEAIENGTDVEALYNGKSPLQLAYESGRESIISLLLKYGASQKLLLHKTVISDSEVFSKLVSSGVAVNTVGERGLSVLMLASLCGNMERVQILLAHGANVHLTDDDGWTALHHAFRSGLVSIVKLLIKAGADVDAQDNKGRACLHLTPSRAISQGRYIVLSLYQHILASGGNINIRDKGGLTPLHRSARSLESHLVELLLQNGANVRSLDYNRRTALIHACIDKSLSHDKLRIATMLVNAGVDVNVVDSEWHTALYYAAKYNDFALVSYLRMKDADVHLDYKLNEAVINAEIRKLLLLDS